MNTIYKIYDIDGNLKSVMRDIKRVEKLANRQDLIVTAKTIR